MIFSNRKKINIDDMPDLICQVILSNTWDTDIMNDVKSEFSFDKTSGSQIRTIAILGAYDLAFIRLNLISYGNIELVEKIIVEVKKIFVSCYKTKTLFAISEEEEKYMNDLFIKSYNSAFQMIIEVGMKNINEMSTSAAEHLLDCLFDGCNSDDIREKYTRKYVKLLSKIYMNDSNFARNIKIIKKGASDKGYKSMQQAHDELIQKMKDIKW